MVTVYIQAGRQAYANQYQLVCVAYVSSVTSKLSHYVVGHCVHFSCSHPLLLQSTKCTVSRVSHPATSHNVSSHALTLVCGSTGATTGGDSAVWGGGRRCSRWEERAVLACRGGAHTARHRENALLHTLAAYSKCSAHTAACPLTNWCHQYTSGVVPNNTGVLPCLSTGETAFVDAKVHS